MKNALAPSKQTLAEFNRQASSKKDQAKRSPKRRAPLAVRLSDEQWEQLERDSKGISYGAYVKDRLFRKSRASKRSAVQDYELLARILAALGQSEVFANLDKLIALSERGELDLSPEVEFELALACACVIEMRDELVRALGLTPKGAP
ncbi:hypothetical protein [uncultured Roseibium sp.]|uniref:hypothetical protein n=1 Tax=uncultured Roseibium sp. TaxID=1936171 RepID=UPI00262E5FF9|nr:hypothetical protein [uncultured Roseibium sp.]